jgi:hypothetical protein
MYASLRKNRIADAGRSTGRRVSTAGMIALLLACSSNDKTDHPTVTGGDLPSDVTGTVASPDASVRDLPGEGAEAPPDSNINRSQVPRAPSDRPLTPAVLGVGGSGSAPAASDAGTGDAGAP